MASRILTQLSKHKDLLLVVAIIGILMLLFVPVPPVLLDLLLILNFSIALLILLLTFYTDKPLSFSTLPSLLLIATLFRLGLNISATRLILENGEAGKVIGAVGEFVVGGNYVIGLVVFFILIVVQYVVVTNGAQRVAEVAARFTLDSMPGKQMSIDADLNMGVITEQEAKERRNNIEKEANFYGAMDGASKFVKGDAIAGIIIILIDIIGGLSIGVAQLGLSWSEALHTYTLLTVGDGIVTQIPSLIIATATGIIITRAATDNHLGDELSKQITSSPKTLFLVATVLVFLSFLPGLPSFYILLLASIFAGIGLFVIRRQNKEKEIEEDRSENDNNPANTQIEDYLTVVPFELSVSNQISSSLQENDGLKQRFESFRKQFARDMGFVIPEFHIVKDTSLDQFSYAIKCYGAHIGNGQVSFDKHLAIDPSGKFLAIDGEKTVEPTYGLPAIWIAETELQLARKSGYTVVDPETTLLTHLTELAKSHAHEFISRIETEKLIARLESTHAGMLDELIPAVLSYSDIQKVLRQLIKEKVSIKNIEMILEALVDKGKVSKSEVFLVEQVREKLKTSLTANLLDSERKLKAATFEPALEQKLVAGLQETENGVSLALDPMVTDTLIKQLVGYSEQMMAQRVNPVIICQSSIRFALKQLLDRVLPQLHVLSINEVPTNIQVQATSMIRLEQGAAS